MHKNMNTGMCQLRDFLAAPMFMRMMEGSPDNVNNSGDLTLQKFRLDAAIFLRALFQKQS